MTTISDDELMRKTPVEAQVLGLWDRWQELDAKIREGHRERRAARRKMAQERKP